MSMETDRIEADLNQSRHRLNDTLEALGHKLSPGQMVDEVLGLAQGQAGEFTLLYEHTADRDTGRGNCPLVQAEHPTHGIGLGQAGHTSAGRVVRAANGTLAAVSR